MSAPIIRLEVQSMKHTVHAMLLKHAAQMDEDIQRAVDSACTPENVSRIVEQTAGEEIKRAIEEEIQKFYRYGDGREAVREVVEKILTERIR